MLPDKNELNDEIMEQINGGFGENLGGIGNEDDELLSANINRLYTCSYCGKMYSAMTERTDGFCPNCEPLAIPKITPEPLVIPKITPLGDIKATVPDLPNKDKLVKIH